MKDVIVNREEKEFQTDEQNEDFLARYIPRYLIDRIKNLKQ